MGIREELDEERRRRRRAGDPRITPEAREILLRITDGDLKNEFQAALDAVSDNDPLLSGSEDALRIINALEDALSTLQEAGLDPELQDELGAVVRLIRSRRGLDEGPGAVSDREVLRAAEAGRRRVPT